MLKGQTAIVTGSTSGIGLSIAEALARAGANVMLNGFGDRKEIEQLRAKLEADIGVTVAYSDADMTRSEQTGKWFPRPKSDSARLRFWSTMLAFNLSLRSTSSPRTSRSKSLRSI